jgi:CubicO group peptidase (beta-lactamase class C family)
MPASLLQLMIDRLVSSLEECYSGTHPFLPAAVVQEFWAVNTAVPNSTWACGWDTPSPQGSTAGEFFSPHSVGHLGFTGTSVWIDLERKIHIIVLSNRVHPHRKNAKITAFRPVLHNAIMKTLLDAEGTEAETTPATPNFTHSMESAPERISGEATKRAVASETVPEAIEEHAAL